MASSQFAWGIDVGTTALKALKLHREADGVSVVAFDVIEHDRFLTEPDVDRDEIIRQTLAKFLERNGTKRESVFIGVPGSSTFARFVKLPPVEARKIPEIVRFEAIQQIPFPLEQVNWDYQTFTNPDSPEVEVGIFAMKKELVAQVMANFQSANMVVEGVQMSPLAVYNAVVFDEITGGKGTIVVDIGAEHTDLIFIDRGHLWLRTINIGGNAFTDSLSKSFKVPFGKAETLKRTAATSKYAKQIFQAMRPVFADLVAEIQRSIGFYQSSHRDSQLQHLIGMGNPFKLPNLQKYIQQELKMDVTRLESFKKATVDSKLAPGLNEHILGMAGAYGLALQGLDKAVIDANLLPTEIARQMVWQQKRPWFAGAAAMIVLGVGLSGYSVWANANEFKQSQESGAAAANDKSIKTATEEKVKFNKLPATYAVNKGQIDSFLNLTNERKIWPLVVTDIFASLPQSHAAVKSSLPREEQQLVVIQSIVSDYHTELAGVNSVASADVAPAANPGMGAMGSMGGGGMPSSMGAGGLHGSEMGTPRAPVAPVGANSADRGFLVTIRGYTPYQDPKLGGYSFVRNHFIQHLMDVAPKPVDTKPDPMKPAPAKAAVSKAGSTNDRPYFFEFEATPYTGWFIAPAAGGNGSTKAMPWGTNKGPFWDAFVPPMMGITDQPEAADGGAFHITGGGGMAPTTVTNKPLDPDYPGREMYGYYQFVTTFKVYIKNNPTP